MREKNGAAPGSSSGMLVFNQHREAIFYLVIAVFICIDLLQLAILLPAIPGLTAARMAGVAALAAFIAIAGFFHLTRKFEISVIVLLSVSYIALVYAALKQGGAPAPTLIYAPFLPIVTTVLMGRKAGIVSLIVSACVLMFCAYAAGAGIATPSPHSPDQLRVLYISAAVLLTIGVTIYAFIYEELITRAMEETSKAQLELQAKADELSESREFLSTVMDSISDGIVAADSTGKLSVFNKQACEFHGLDAMPLASSAWPETYSLYEADGATLMAEKDVPLFRALEGEKVFGREIAIAAPNAPKRYVISNAAPMRNSKGERIGAVATMRDITRERAQEERIRNQNREIDQFARVASIDLQAPLNRIILATQSLRKTPEAKASAAIRNDLASVASAAEKMGALIKDVLYMSRLPIGELSLQSVIARDCIEAAIDMSGINEADCRLDFRFAGSPDVVADPHSLTLVFKNLIENAWRHAPSEEKPHVEFTCLIENRTAILGVKDNGAGMTKEQIDRLFMPFEHVRTEDGGEGTGLGLLICRKSLTRMGGEFWVESVTGHGCHFRLRLPLADAIVS